MSLDFIAGCVGGAAGVIVGHPLDTVKVRLQIQSGTNAKYNGTFGCLKSTIQKEGVRGLYKGIQSPLFGVAGVNALIFGVYGSLRPYVHGAPGNDALWAHFLAGSVSGAVQSVVASPMELVKTRMQINENSSGTAKSPSSFQVLKNIYTRERGFRGVFKGWGVTLAREVPGFGTYFAAYEALTTKSGREVGTLGMMMAGGMAGVFSWIVTFPIDVVKTRLQSDTKGRYKGAVDCAIKTWNAEGNKAFWRGLGSAVIRAFPTNAATFTVVTYILRWAESPAADGIQNGKEYLREILEESSKIQETFEQSLKLPLPHYFLPSSSPLTSNCVNIISKYQSNTRENFNFLDNLSSLKTSEKDQDSNEVKGASLSPIEEFSLELDSRTQQDNCKTGDAMILRTTPTSAVFQDTEIPAEESSLFRQFLRINLTHKLKTLLSHLFTSMLPAIELCSCWDENCVCFN